MASSTHKLHFHAHVLVRARVGLCLTFAFGTCCHMLTYLALNNCIEMYITFVCMHGYIRGMGPRKSADIRGICHHMERRFPWHRRNFRTMFLHMCEAPASQHTNYTNDQHTN